MLDCNQLGVATINCVPLLFQNVVTWILIFAGVVALFLIIMSGIKFVTSGGDPKQIDGAKNTLTYAVIGLIVVLLSFTIINFISFVTGTDCIKKFGFSNCATPNASSRPNPSSIPSPTP